MIGLMLLAAHMAGDFIFQTKWMADNKMKWQESWEGMWALVLHCWVYIICFVPVVVYAKMHGLMEDSRGFYLLLIFTHLIADCRRWASGDDWAPKPILVDQAIHVVTLAVLGAMFF